jgi:multisubunit Na+/H+ antiporter MnhF subunit
MGVVAASLAVMSFLHLSGSLAKPTGSFDGSGAGIAEAVICVALSCGTVRLLRRRTDGQAVALASTGFAIAGFLVGLRFTLGGGTAIDIAYHLSALPILCIALIALVRMRARDRRPLSAADDPTQGVSS